MLTTASSTWRQGRLVGMPSCASTEELVQTSGTPAIATLGVKLRGQNPQFDGSYVAKQAHNPVGAAST